MKLELLEDKSADEIKSIWLEYHKQKDVLTATIPTDTFKLLVERAKEFPLFIFPLPRDQGFEFFLLQFSGNTVHFTPLLCYQVRPVTFYRGRKSTPFVFLFHCSFDRKIIEKWQFFIFCQVHKENAPECLNIVHYTELSDKLNIVLMRGEYDKNVINAQEAQCLVNQLQLYYTQNNQSKLDLLKKFTQQPDSFKHMDVINELQNLSIK